MVALFLGSPAVKIQFPFPHPKQNLVAASQCGQEVLYLREILLDFHQPQTSPTTVYEDNLACIAMSENAVRRKYSRHIDIRKIFRTRTCRRGGFEVSSPPYSPYDGRCADQRPPYSSTC